MLTSKNDHLFSSFDITDKAWRKSTIIELYANIFKIFNIIKISRW